MNDSKTRSKFSADIVIAAIGQYKGNITAVAQSLHASRMTIYKYIAKHPSIRAALDEARETMIDNVESVLYKQALNGEAWAVCFFLKCQAKHRGYIERQEVTGKDGGPINAVMVYIPDNGRGD